MSIYQKIRKSNLLKKTAFEAAQAGAQGTGIDFNKKEDGDGPKKVANPITNTSSPFKDTDPNKKVEKKIVSADPDGDGIYTAQDFIRTSINKPGVSGGYTGGGTFKNEEEKKWYEGQIKQRMDSGMSNEDAIQDYRNTFKIGDKKPDTPATTSSNVSLTPRTVEEKTDPTQTYNMSFKNVENANWAEGAKRRGTRRAERRANKDIRRYEEGSKGFLGLGKGKGKGELSANVIAAGEKTGKTIKGVKYDADGNITGDDNQKVTDQMRSRATNLSMNKYNQGLNEFNYKPGTNKKVDESGEGYEVYDGPVGDIKVDNNSVDFSKYGMKDYASEFKESTDKLLEGLPSFSGPFNKKSKLSKNTKAFKNKSGRGAGY